MRKTATVACALLVLTLSACSNMTRTEQAALSAGTIGGVGGLIIGTLVGGPLVGAMVGAAGGAAYGAMREGD
jgi:osmotically inducible lipoprotein OsmB